MNLEALANYRIFINNNLNHIKTECINKYIIFYAIKEEK